MNFKDKNHDLAKRLTPQEWRIFQKLHFKSQQMIMDGELDLEKVLNAAKQKRRRNGYENSMGKS